MSEGFSTANRITRRDAIRRAVLFSSGMMSAGPIGRLLAGPPQTSFAGEGLHVLALGDFGTIGDPNQKAVARQMARFAQSLQAPLDAVLALGDNFYRRIWPERFQMHFEDMYSAEHLACPFYACVGNHDYGTARYDFQEGKLQMQLDYAKNNPQSRWKLPAKWYTVELPNQERPIVKLIVLDGNYWEGGLTPQEKLTQKRFFEAELKRESNAVWTWVVNHFPMFSQSAHRGDNQALIRDWGPLLQEYPVALFIAGHDHTLQHLQVEGYSTSFIISGAGGAALYDVTPSNRGFTNNRHLGFNHIYITPDQIDVQYINADGDSLYAFRRDRQGRVEVTSKA